MSCQTASVPPTRERILVAFDRKALFKRREQGIGPAALAAESSGGHEVLVSSDLGMGLVVRHFG